MSDKHDQHTVGIPQRRRGQQVGDTRSAIQNRDDADWEETPEINGDVRRSENQFIADNSSQHFGGDATAPDHVSPSTPAAIPEGQPLGQSGGEKEFKQRQQKGR